MRKRSGLTQDEFAYLLGIKYRSEVSRYEYSRRGIPLEIGMAYEVIFQAPLFELLNHEYEKVDWEVRTRAAKLITCLEKRPFRGITKQKCEFLAEIVRAPQFTNHHRR